MSGIADAKPVDNGWPQEPCKASPCPRNPRKYVIVSLARSRVLPFAERAFRKNLCDRPRPGRGKILQPAREAVHLLNAIARDEPHVRVADRVKRKLPIDNH